MKPAKRLIARLSNVAVVSVLFVGSCAVPVVAYVQSPWWFLDKVGADGPSATASFFVATSDSSKGSQQIRVVKFDPKKKEQSDVRYHLPDGRLSYTWGPGEGNASIYVTTEKQGSQLVRVFVSGDTPWTSLSEYRVVDNTVYPLRHAHSAAWLLLGIPVLLLLFSLLTKPIQRGIRRLIGVESD